MPEWFPKKPKLEGGRSYRIKLFFQRDFIKQLPSMYSFSCSAAVMVVVSCPVQLDRYILLLFIIVVIAASLKRYTWSFVVLRHPGEPKLFVKRRTVFIV